MANLSEHEWNCINNSLLEVYTLDNISDLSTCFLQMIKQNVPYSHAFFVINDTESTLKKDISSFINFEDKEIDKYIDYYYNVDYANYIFDNNRSVVFRDSDILDTTARHNTELYLKFFKPANIEYGAGIAFSKNGDILGCLNLFRTPALGDFSEKDIYILNLYKGHLENIIFSLKKASTTNDGKHSINTLDYSSYSLSNREIDIIELILSGLSNQEIADSLCITLSTVKKHVYNIFTKLGINSRNQLFNMVSSNP